MSNAIHELTHPFLFVNSSALQLATEILTHIFFYFVERPCSWVKDHDTREMGNSLIAASQVCFTWREVALNCPLLWTFISPTMRLPQIQEFLTRSNSMPLDAVYLNLSGRTEAEAALESVLLQTHRTHNLQLATILPSEGVPGPEPAMEPEKLHKILLDRLPGLAADSLRSFSLCIYSLSKRPGEADAEYVLSLPDRVFRGESQNLRHIFIDSPFCILPTSTLLLTATSLEFTGIHDTLLTALILNAPNVEKVDVELDHEFDELLEFPDFIPHHTVSLVSLQSLNITGTGICPLQLFHILERAPHLCHLHATLDESSDDIDLHPTSISLPDLETVKLEDIEKDAFRILLSLAPWKAAKRTPHIDLDIFTDWDLSNEDSTLR